MASEARKRRHLEADSADGEGHVVKRVDVGRDQVLVEFKDQSELHRLSRDRRRVVSDTLDGLVSLLLDSALEKELSARQLEEKGRIAIDTMRLLVEGGPDRLEALIAALEAPEADVPADASDEDAEARAHMRAHALYQRIVQDSYSVAELASQMRISRQRLKQLRDQDRLFAIEVPFRRGWFYPRWQFEISSGKPSAALPELLSAARDSGLDAVGFQVLMNNAEAGDGISPLGLLEAGDKKAVISILHGVDQ